MNIAPMRIAFSMLVLALCARAGFAADTPVPAAGGKIDPREIETTLVPDKAAVMPGEPFYVSLVVKNNSKRDLILWASNDYPDNYKLRFRGFKSRKIVLGAMSKDGVKLPEFDWVHSRGIDWAESEEFHSEKIPASGSYTFRVFVPQWIVFEKPGSYILSAETKLVFSLPPAEGRRMNEDELLEVPTMIFVRPLSTLINRPPVVEADKSAVAVPVTASAAIEVAPFDKKKMDDIAGDLLKKTSPGETSSLEAREAADKLLEIPDERAIPWLLRKLKESSPESNKDPGRFESEKREDWIDALHALSKFNNDAALEGLKSGMESVTGPEASSDRQIAIKYLLQSPHPGALPCVLGYYNFPDVYVRLQVVEALGTKAAPGQAIPILKKMTKDKSELIRNSAMSYLQKLTAKKPG